MGAVMKGECLCGQVQFEVDGEISKLYQCHCPLCRKQNGATSNTATLLPKERFHWLAGEELISKWKKESGFTSHFCSNCGSTVPNPLRETPYMWVPAGLLEDHGEFEVVLHLYVNDRASWDCTVVHGIPHESMPEWDEFVQLLHGPNP